MTFFESLLALMMAAILLLQLSRRLGLPYPAMLAAAGVVVALIPGAPTIRIEPQTALALFIAPALLDAAFDFPAGMVRRLWRPLVALAVGAVLVTALFVGWIGWTYAGLPLAAALALGAIVAPPDAAAATAVLAGVALPRQSVVVLKGESLLNDAIALLLFDAAVAVQSGGGIGGNVGLHLALAAPGGVLLGIALAWLYRRCIRYVAGTLGGNLLEFVNTFWVWIIAERLHLSAVLCVVAFAMTIARSSLLTQHARMRVHSYAVWESVVFFLNVLAFLLMGMQARVIVAGMTAARLHEALGFAGVVIAGVIGIRLLWVMAYNRLSARWPVLRGDPTPVSLAQGVLVGWCGMRGLVTLATAFALPASFPQRELIVLAAFAVVLATLLIQGLTLNPLIRLLRLDGDDSRDTELAAARADLADAALALLKGETGLEADHLRHLYQIKRDAVADPPLPDPLEDRRRLGLAIVQAERRALTRLRAAHQVGPDVFEVLQEELDFRELALTSEEERHIEES